MKWITFICKEKLQQFYDSLYEKSKNNTEKVKILEKAQESWKERSDDICQFFTYSEPGEMTGSITTYTKTKCQHFLVNQRLYELEFLEKFLY